MADDSLRVHDVGGEKGFHCHVRSASDSTTMAPTRSSAKTHRRSRTEPGAEEPVMRLGRCRVMVKVGRVQVVSFWSVRVGGRPARGAGSQLIANQGGVDKIGEI